MSLKKHARTSTNCSLKWSAHDPPTIAEGSGGIVKRVLCWIVGHDWKIVFVNQRKHLNLFHLHSMAGMDARCKRCSAEWIDSGGNFGIFDKEY